MAKNLPKDMFPAINNILKKHPDGLSYTKIAEELSKIMKKPVYASSTQWHILRHMSKVVDIKMQGNRATIKLKK